MSDERDKQIIAIINKLDNIRDELLSIIDKKEAPEISPKNQTGASFKLITLDQTDFDLQDVTIAKLFEVKTGTSKNGVEWTKRSMVIKDQYNQQREVIAWGETVDKLKRLAEGDTIDIYKVKEISQYTKRDGTVITQFVIGSQTDIRIVEESGGQHIL